MNKVCRDCRKVTNGKRLRCQHCNSSNLGAYYSPQERLNATDMGSDWRSHLYVSNSEYRSSKPGNSEEYQPAVQSVPNSASRALKRSVRRPRMTMGSPRGTNRFFATLKASPFAWLTITLMPLLLATIHIFPASPIEAAIGNQVRGVFGIVSDSQFRASNGGLTSDENLRIRSQALKSLWESRREANTNGYVETVEFDTQTSQAISHPALTNVVARPNGERLDWSTTSRNSTLAGLAELMTDAALVFTQAGPRISFRNSFNDCQGWIQVSDGLIETYQIDCSLTSSGYPTQLRYGLTQDDLLLIERAERRRDG